MPKPEFLNYDHRVLIAGQVYTRGEWETLPDDVQDALMEADLKMMKGVDKLPDSEV